MTKIFKVKLIACSRSHTCTYENNKKKKNQIDSQKTKVLTLQNNIFIKEEQSTDIWQTETSFSGSLQNVKTTVIKKLIGCVHDINYVTHQHELFLMLMRPLVEGIKLMPVFLRLLLSTWRVIGQDELGKAVFYYINVCGKLEGFKELPSNCRGDETSVCRGNKGFIVTDKSIYYEGTFYLINSQGK